MSGSFKEGKMQVKTFDEFVEEQNAAWAAENGDKDITCGY